MAKTLSARGSDGRVAIHEPGANLDNPLANLGSIYFHSALDYLYIVQTHTVTVPLPATPGSSFSSLVLAAVHGLGRVPMLLGRRLDTGASLLGTTLIDSGGNGTFRKVTLCADATYIYLHYSGSSIYGPNHAIGLPVEIHVLGNPSL